LTTINKFRFLFQIVTKENVSLGFGILEFARADEAETAYDKFSGYDLNGVKLNIYYCIPGKSAVHMFNRIMFKYVSMVLLMFIVQYME